MIRYFWCEGENGLGWRLFRFKSGKLYEMIKYASDESQRQNCFWGQVGYDRERRKILGQSEPLSFEEVIDRLKHGRKDLLQLVLEDV